jgi:putative FmdB family regulatory protein
MPIYEFYCADCHTIFNFFSRRVNTEKRPSCPKCKRQELERKWSLFAISKGHKESESGNRLPDFDEARLGQALESLAGEVGAISENDPKAMAQVMRKLYAATGLKLKPGMEEAICRMEAGEDPDRIEEEMESILEEEDPFAPTGKIVFKDICRHFLPPKVDETLYEL